jgi:phosphatidylserine decarboxylase
MIGFVRNNLLWTHGLVIVAATGCAALLAFFLMPAMLYPIVLFFLFSVYFFRNPQRVCPQAGDPAVIISPSDGKIVDIAYDPAGGLNGYHYRVSIFLSPVDVHVNWAPVAGMVNGLHYKPGKFIMAFVPKSSDLNERNDLVLGMRQGTIMVRQIAGTVARRICWWVEQGESIKAGESFGMIRFGSRIDLFLPESIALGVCVGDRVKGGQTILGRFTWQ